jgi:hypothetical protein
MRTWQVERRKRTRHLIELGALVVKSGIVDLTGDDRATIFGALLWVADKLQTSEVIPFMIVMFGGPLGQITWTADTWTNSLRNHEAAVCKLIEPIFSSGRV